jgi:hypothetical protein
MTSLLYGLQQAKLEAYELPYDLEISTATITCKINVMFNVSNIAYYFNDFDDIIIGKKYGNRIINNLISVKKIKTGKKKKRKEKKNFFNQVSLIFRSATLMGIDPETLSLKEKFKNINVKLFINGSIQMTGCKHLDNIKKCLEILFDKFKITKAILNKNMEFEKKMFVSPIENLYLISNTTIKKINTLKNKKNINFIKSNENLNLNILTNNTELNNIRLNNEFESNIDNIPNNKINLDILNIKNVYKFDIRMINTNFNIGFQINRDKLYQMLVSYGYDAVFDPIIHACVNVKYTIPQLNKTVSIFVFESGSITIAGSNSCQQILLTYNFINKFILSNYSKLLSKTITPQLIIQLIRDMK